MKQRLNVCRGHHKSLRIDSKDTELSFVPHPVAVDPIPIPRTHLSRCDPQATALLAFEKPGVGFLKLRRAGANSVLELGIEPLQLPGLTLQFVAHPYLSPQHSRND